MRKLVIVVVVLIALGLVADRAAAYVAEGMIATKVEEREGVSEADVDVHGFPFLTQALSGEFGEVELRLPTVDTAVGDDEGLLVEDVDVVLHDVRTQDGYSSATAGSVTGTAFLPYDAFRTLGPVRVGYGGASPAGE